jgi:hypothetical protein
MKIKAKQTINERSQKMASELQLFLMNELIGNYFVGMVELL